jgi:hypothetical protein
MNIRELVRQEAGFSLGGPWTRGRVLYTQTAATGSATGGAVDGTTSSTAGGTYNVHVMQVSTGTLNVIWEHSATAGGTGVYTVLASANITAITGTILAIGSGTSIFQFVRHRHTNTVATGTFDIAAGFSRA